MAKNLVIVESPAKVKTIKKFLGEDFEVVASMGHVRDLPKSQLGVDIEDDYEPRYITIRGKGDLLAALRKEVKKADVIYLATDPDREGEAISWHLYFALNLEDKTVKRITFNEITKNAVKASIKSPRKIDMDLVDAQQARRVIDRIVGYSISPVLWAKVKRGLSAGRVQSSTLRLICDREDEISAFIPEEYWTLQATLKLDGDKRLLKADFYGDENGKIEVTSEAEMAKIVAAVEKEDFVVKDVKHGSRERKSPLPFTTSTLQQEASKKLNFTTQKTMRLAQELYEGVDIGKETVALITYLRTDSTRISDEAMARAKKYIEKKYGAVYFGGMKTQSKSSGKVQDAHEAIRPTDITRTPEMMAKYLSKDLAKLYELIWKRFTASTMAAAKYDTMNAKLGAGEYEFRISASKVSFDGFLSVYNPGDEKEENNTLLNSLDRKSKFSVKAIQPEQHFTQPPAHFTEASLVKTLEELGIGRPSTYAPTITTLLARRYVMKEGKNLFVSELGEAVNSIMVASFPDVVDENFTAKMESQLDSVENGELAWKEIIREFYPNLSVEIKKAQEELEKIEVRDEVTDVICENCGRNMVIKYGPHGKFLACPGFPECRNTKLYLEAIEAPCPKCGKQIFIRKTKKGRRYYGCEDNPNCDFMSWQKLSPEKCEKCGHWTIISGKKIVCQNKDCNHIK